MLLRVDAKERARAYSNGMQVVVSIADYFEFFERQVLGGRERIAEGPWKGVLRENHPGKYTIAGNDQQSGAAYKITFSQIDSSNLELAFTFTAPLQASHLGFDILKLSSDLFIGAAIVGAPSLLTDAKEVSVQPLPFAKRLLLTDKNRVLLRGAFCDLEITDLDDSRSIYVADGRNVPWDKRKSILLGAGRDNLSPGREYSFRYALRCMPPTGAVGIKAVEIAGRSAGIVDPWSFYAVPPKKETKADGFFRLKLEDAIFGVSGGAAETLLAKEMRALTSMPLSINSGEFRSSRRGIFIERTAAGSLPSEGFEIITSPEKVVIRGDERGCLYGVYTLLGRLRKDATGWGIACGRVSDWPDLPIRGACMELLIPAIRDIELMRSYLDAFSRARGNTVILLHLPQQIRAWQEGRDDGGWTKAQVAEIARYARSLQMDVWGGVGSAFRPTDFPELDVWPGSNFYNPLRDQSYEVLFALYDQIHKAYKPSTLLVSHDEIRGLSLYAAAAMKSTADIFALDIRRIHDWLGARKVQTAIWGDMLLDHMVWEDKVGSANSMNPEYGSEATHEALSFIPRDTLILDWHYRRKKSYPSIGYFRRNGFTVIGCAWNDPVAAKVLSDSVRNFGGQGVLATDWGIWPTLSPAATTLYAPLCGWSSACSVEEGSPDVSALAEVMRNTHATEHPGAQTPVSLDSVANGATTEDSARGKSLFGVGPVLDLRALEPGKRVLAGVVFDIQPNNGGQVNNCVVVSTGDYHESRPRTLFFPSALQAGSIAFLHTCFVETPQVIVRKLGSYVVEFASGRSETIDLLENWNITDIRSSEGLRHNVWSFVRSPDILIGARSAWRGMSAAGISLNLQVFIWKNPYPDEKIRSIRLSAVSSPPGSKVALIGLTLLQE